MTTSHPITRAKIRKIIRDSIMLRNVCLIGTTRFRYPDSCVRELLHKEKHCRMDDHGQYLDCVVRSSSFSQIFNQNLRNGIRNGPHASGSYLGSCLVRACFGPWFLLVRIWSCSVRDWFVSGWYSVVFEIIFGFVSGFVIDSSSD